MFFSSFFACTDLNIKINVLTQTNKRHIIHNKHKLNLESYKFNSFGIRRLFTILSDTCLYLSFYKLRFDKYYRMTLPELQMKMH